MRVVSDLNGEIATYRHSKRMPVSFARVTLDMRDARDWTFGAVLLHRENGDIVRCATASFSALSAGGHLFPVWVRPADGKDVGPFLAEAIVTGIPVSADCFVFSRREDGFWDGVTVTVRSASTAIVPYACDAS